MRRLNKGMRRLCEKQFLFGSGIAAIWGCILAVLMMVPLIAAQAVGPTGATLPSFEVASIKPSGSLGRHRTLYLSRRQNEREPLHIQISDDERI